MELSGVLLAGGKSRRFSPNKICLECRGIPLVAGQMVKLGFFAGDIVITTSSENSSYIHQVVEQMERYIHILGLPQDFELPPISIVTDDIAVTGSGESIGPIAGIYTGLRRSKNSSSLVIASDMPFISFRLLKFLTVRAEQDAHAHAVIVRGWKGIEALCGIYSKKCIRIIKEGILDRTFKISDILEGLDISWIGPEELERKNIDEYNFFNINSRKDIEDYRKILDRGVDSNGTDNIRGGTGQKWKDDFFRGTGQGTHQKKI